MNKNLGQNFILAFLVMVFYVLPLFSYTYLGIFPPGDPIRGYSARTTAMGNISAACIKDEPNLYFNPASLMSVKDRQASLSLNYIPAEEKIVIEDQAPLLNFQTYTLGSFVISLPVKDWALGFGVFPLNDMQYVSENKIWQNSILAEYEKIESKGTLYSYTFSGGHKVGNFSFGLGFNFLKSDYETIIDSYDFTTGTQDYSKTQNKLDGSNMSVSSVFDLSRNVLIGFSYIEDAELKQKGDKKLKIPKQYTFSTTVNFNDSVVALELISTENKKAEFHIGVEHFPEFGKVPIRYGFGFIPHPADNKNYTLSISLGSGLEISRNIFFDFAGSYETINTKVSESYILQNSYKLICTTRFVF